MMRNKHIIQASQWDFKSEFLLELLGNRHYLSTVISNLEFLIVLFDSERGESERWRPSPDYIISTVNEVSEVRIVQSHWVNKVFFFFFDKATLSWYLSFTTKNVLTNITGIVQWMWWMNVCDLEKYYYVHLLIQYLQLFILLYIPWIKECGWWYN